MKRLLGLRSESLLKFGTAFLLFFIPLYPKIPFLDVKNTWVYIRLEDFAVAFFLLLWALFLIRGKSKIRSPLTVPIFVYWFAGAVSTLLAYFFLRSELPNYFPKIALLHALRRVEYLALFFLAFSAVKNRRDILNYIGVFSACLTIIILYGFGQRVFSFPAFLTMNEEFAKGAPLILDITNRLSSTFAGHYDLAAYLVFSITFFFSLFFAETKKIFKLFFFVLIFAAYILLLHTDSRVSFLVYVLTIVLTLIIHRKKVWILPVLAVSFIIMMNISGTYDRLLKTVRIRQVLYDLETGNAIAAIGSIDKNRVLLEQQDNPAEKLPVGSQFISLPRLTQPTPLPTIMVIQKTPLAKGEGEIATVSGKFLIHKALTLDISFTTRFQAEWPNAIKAWQRNLLFGSGYSVLSTATDNDYLRLLGETGILGLFSFILIFLVLFVLFRHAAARAPDFERRLLIGIGCGIIGLAINALLIDVFEASKIAYTLWLWIGIGTALALKYAPVRINYLKEIKNILISPFLIAVYFSVLVFYLFLPVINGFFVGEEFTILKFAADHFLLRNAVSIAGNFVNVPRALEKIIYILAYNLFWLKPEGYRLVGVLLYISLLLIFYAGFYHFSRSRMIALASVLLLLADIRLMEFSAGTASWMTILFAVNLALLAVFILLLFKHPKRYVLPLAIIAAAGLYFTIPYKESFIVFSLLTALAYFFLAAYLKSKFIAKKLAFFYLMIIFFPLILLHGRLRQFESFASDRVKAGKINKDSLLAVRKSFLSISPGQRFEFFFVDYPMKVGETATFINEDNFSDALTLSFEQASVSGRFITSLDAGLIQAASSSASGHVYVYEKEVLAEAKKIGVPITPTPTEAKNTIK